MVVQGDQAATSERSPTPLLDRISSPADLKTLPLSQLSALAAEIRQELINVVTRNGGHLGADGVRHDRSDSHRRTTRHRT